MYNTEESWKAYTLGSFYTRNKCKKDFSSMLANMIPWNRLYTW